MTDWPRVTLGAVAVDMQPGFACQPTNDPGGIPQLRTNNVSPHGGIDLSETKRVPANDAWIKRYSLKPGDVLFNNTNSPTLVGKTALFDEDGLFLFSNHMTRIRVATDIAEPRYGRSLSPLGLETRNTSWADHSMGQPSGYQPTPALCDTASPPSSRRAAPHRGNSRPSPPPPRSPCRGRCQCQPYSSGSLHQDVRRSRDKPDEVADQAGWRRVQHRFGRDAEDKPAGVLGWRNPLGHTEGSICSGGLVPRSHGTHVDRGWLGKLLGYDDARAIRSSLFQGADRSRRSIRCPDVHQSGIQESRLWSRNRTLVSVRLVQAPPDVPSIARPRGHIQGNLEADCRVRRTAGTAHQGTRRFREILESLMSIERERRRSMQRVAALLDLLFNRAFSGDLTASWRGRHVEELLREMRRSGSAADAAP